MEQAEGDGEGGKAAPSDSEDWCQPAWEEAGMSPLEAPTQQPPGENHHADAFGVDFLECRDAGSDSSNRSWVMLPDTLESLQKEAADISGGDFQEARSSPVDAVGSEKKVLDTPPRVDESTESWKQGHAEPGDKQPSGEALRAHGSICEHSPYLFGRSLQAEETMTLNFMIILSKDSSFDESKSKICVVFYKQPGRYLEFAKVDKRERLLTGYARIPIADLKKGPIFYKYALLDKFRKTQECELEQIYLKDLKSPDNQLHRIIEVPREKIRVGETWTLFGNPECCFPSKRNSSWFTGVRKSVSNKITKHLVCNFLNCPKSWEAIEEMAGKLESYSKSFDVFLWDAEQGEASATCYHSDKEAMKDNMCMFVNEVIEQLRMEEQELPRLLFAFRIAFCYNVSLSSKAISKAEKLLQFISTFPSKFQDLRQKQSYITALKEICLRDSSSTLLIWLIPLLYALTEPEDPFLSQAIPSKAILKLRNDDKKQREVLSMMSAHKSFISSCAPLAQQVLEMLALKNFSKEPLLALQLPPQLLLETLHHQIIDTITTSTHMHEEDLNVALSSITIRMKSWLQELCPSGSAEHHLQLLDEDKALQCLSLVYMLLMVSWQHWKLMPTSSTIILLQMLEMFTCITGALQENQEFQLLSSVERFKEFSEFAVPWLRKHLPKPSMDEKCFLKETESWQKLFSLKLLCMEWIQKWQNLIYGMFEEWLKKVDDNHLVDFYCAFVRMDRHCDTELERCFADHLIQCVKVQKQSEDSKLWQTISKFIKTKKPSVGRVLSAIIEKTFSEMNELESTQCFSAGTDSVLASLLRSPGICDLLSIIHTPEQKQCLRISNRAEALLLSVSELTCFMGYRLFSGDIPCNILSRILRHRELFKKMLCVCDSSFSICITKVLDTRQLEYKELEKLKKQRCAFLQLCCAVADVVQVDQSIVEKSIRDKESFKDQVSVRSFSKDGKSVTQEHLLAHYREMMGKIHSLEESQCFWRLWKLRAEQAKATGSGDIVLSIDDVQEKIYKLAIKDLQETYLALQNFSISLGAVQSQFEALLGETRQLTKEFKIMEATEGKASGEAAWIAMAVEKIENYLTLSKVVNVAKMIDDLRQMLQLNGDFQSLVDLAKYEEEEFKNKPLNYMTQDLMEVKKTLSDITPEVMDFLKELLECARQGFTSWIKTIIKDKSEIPVFVDLASVSAGGNEKDIDRVRFFRNAMAASAPIVLDLCPTDGFKQFSAALSFIREAVGKDSNLTKNLRDTCNNKKWLQMVHDLHGSVERSSILQARSINGNGIFTISLPQKFKRKRSDTQGRHDAQHCQSTLEHGPCSDVVFSSAFQATLEDCISLRLLKDGTESMSQAAQTRTYSLAQLTELQNKLMLIATKADQGREEVNRFLEILEKVETVGKLYLELLRVGNILFIDWEAEIYCDPEHRVKVYAEFSIAGILVQSSRPILEELDGLCKAMEHCLVEWKKHLETQRNIYYHLNFFTARQLFYLCNQLARPQTDGVEPCVLNMLSIIKHDVTKEDIEKALKQALMTPLDSVDVSARDGESVTWHNYVIRFPQLIRSLAESGYEEAVAKAALQSCLQQAPVTEQLLMDFAFEQGDDKELVEVMSRLYEERKEAFLQKSRKFKTGNGEAGRGSFSALADDELVTSFESLPCIYDKVNLLWDAYCQKLSGLVSDKYIGLDVCGETLKQLAALEGTRVERSLPVGLEGGKPFLIMCKEEEMLLYMLSLYRHTEAAPLPTYDEVLVCTPDTEEEEVELIIKRALSTGSQDRKIYSLLGAEKLVYKVSKQLESHFFRMVQLSSCPNYHFVIFCSAKAHNSYVITAFDTYKAAFPCCSKAEIQAYLKRHLSVPCGTAPVAQAFEEPHQQNVKFVFSERAGMGKSLFVENTVRKVRSQLGATPLVHKTVRLMESAISFQTFLEELLSIEEFPTKTQPSIFHIDISPVVSKGLYRLLIELCILRHVQSPGGLVWKCKPSHLYLIEYLVKERGISSTRKREISSEMEEKFLDLFPTVKCVSPLRVLDLLQGLGSGPPVEMREEQFDQAKLRSEAFQRSYQYLSRYKQKEKLDYFFFHPGTVEGTNEQCLRLLLDFCSKDDPSWMELSNFTNFLNFQLQMSEKSVFCSPVAGKEFQGFKTFVIKFMIAMSKDFAMPSLNMSDESVPNVEKRDQENVLTQYQLRRKWEQESHPYIVFHAEGDSMEFLGFHIDRNFDAIDARSQAVLEKNVIDRRLYLNLKAQNVPFNKKFESLSRQEQLEALCRVFGVKCMEDPDDSFQLTLDNTMKMLAIHLRFQCNIPVIIMGETGCGKTKLVQFMCSLQRAGRDIQNMVVVRVHGSTTSQTIHRKVRQAVELADLNEKQHGMDTVLFFDEANTSEAIFAIKEVLCDHSINGEKIPTRRLKVVAACNPYKRHTKETIEKLEKAGLGYQVRSEDTPEKLGYIPLRQLVYRVQPLPPSLLPLVWDFGELNERTQSLYIREIIKSTLENKIPAGNLDVFTDVIATSQKFLRERKDECRVASLRDIDRCMSIVVWFYNLRELLFPQIDKKRKRKNVEEPTLNDAQRALVLSVGACYYVSLESRQAYLEEIARCFAVPTCRLRQEIELCQEVFLDNISIPEGTACNNALRENIFMMVMCMDLRVPLFLVGKPGSSKSLSKTIAVNAMKGQLSENLFFKRCKEVQLVSFQCSPHSKPEGIVSIFRQCAQFQKEKNLDEFASVVLLDEIGLAEDSPDMPLKTLHPLLEDGCVDDDSPEPYKKVGFVGISNWALDPAKMNRGLLVFRTDPSKEELVETAKGICGDKFHLERVEHLFPILANFYCKVLEMQETEFFGLRDFYSLIKMIVAYAQDRKCSSQEELLVKAIQRNFGGSHNICPLEIFLNCTNEVRFSRDLETGPIHLLLANMAKQQMGFMSRYLLLLTTNQAAFQIIQMSRLVDPRNCDIIFGSGFPRDQDYSQVCRSVNRVKVCMEMGRLVVLLNIQNLYESLYDVLNQCFVRLGGNHYVDLGLGTHRVKSRVKEDFRLIIIEEKNIVYTQFPTPLLNRLEKHCLDMNTILHPQQRELKRDLQKWARLFVTIENPDHFRVWSGTLTPQERDVFIGFSEDTSAAIALDTSQSACSNPLEPYGEQVLHAAKSKLVECATPDAVLRLKYSCLEDAERVHELYFNQQKHNSLVGLLRETMKQQPRSESTTRPCLQVSTHARLVNQKDLEVLRKTLNLPNKIHCLFLNQFDTEYAFRQDLRSFFSEPKEEKLLLVQFHFDEPQSSKRLLACAKYCITDERRKSARPHLLYIVLVTKVPRVLGGCSYLAFDSGEWKSIHLDDLMPPENFKANLGQLSKMTIAEIFASSSLQCLPAGSPEDSAALEDRTEPGLLPEENLQLLSVDTMIKESIQKAVIQLEDKGDNSQRATERIQILHNLLFHSQNSTLSSRFMAVLKRRICRLLKEREEISHEPREWIFRRALSTEFILEDTSFRQALWMHLADLAAHMFAQILAVTDANNNLDHVAQGSPFAELWLETFQDERLLKIEYTRKVVGAKIPVLSMTEDPNTSLFCQFPFSWVFKAYLDEIWERVYHTRGQPKVPMEEPARFFQNLVKNVTVLNGSKPEMIRRYANDFLRMAFPGQNLPVYEILSRVFLVSAEQLCFSVGRGEMDFSLIWLHIEYFYLREDYQLFVDVAKSDGAVVDELQKLYRENPPEMFVALDALNILLKKVQPTEKALLPFDACVAWLESVKSIKPWVEWMSMDNYQLQFYQKKKELMECVLHRWTCTNIVYMLIDHLLHNETQIEEKLLKLVVKQFIFLWNRLYATPGCEPEKTFDWVTKVLKKCNENADIVYLVKGVKECKSCLREITDPAELPCSHIFCTQCILEWADKRCKICKKEFPEDYIPTASEATREAVACHNKFRRKCNSFFVEFVTVYFLSGRDTPCQEVVERLIQFMACKPSKPEHREGRRFVYKPKSELSPFEECMDTSPTVQSSLLKLLLRCGFDNMKVHLERYLSQMEEKITSNQSNSDHFYFMVVHCLEDFMHSSSQEDDIRLAQNWLSAADLSAFRWPEVSRINTLQFIAQLRLSISHVAAVLGRQLLGDANTPAAKRDKKDEKDLVNAMKNLVARAQTPWLQVFLIRNLCNTYGLISMWKILQAEEWILPQGVEMSQNITAWLNATLIFLVLEKAEKLIGRKDPKEIQTFTAVMKQMENILQLPSAPDMPLEDRLRKTINALVDHETAGLLGVVFHTALTLVLSRSSITHLLSNICFQPSVVKGSYLPTMPGDLLFDEKNWKIGPFDKLWTCQCGSYWIVTRCGFPTEVKQCTCGAKVGGIRHNPEKGFSREEITEDKTKTGYLLESPSLRRNDLERSLSPACVALARALLHSALLLGTCTDKQAILDLMKEKAEDVESFFQGHLQKDIGCLAEALGRNMEDTVLTIHLFLQRVSDNPAGNSKVLGVLAEKKDRTEWEDCFKDLAQPFFQDLEHILASAKHQRMREGPKHSDLLLKIAYSDVSPFKDPPSRGLIDRPCMWRFEQKMTIQTLMHFLQQEHGEGDANPYPILLELLSKLQNIQHIRYLPDIFRMQKALIHFFQNSHKGENYSVQQFLEQTELSDDLRAAFGRAIETIQNVWSNIKTNPSSSGISLPPDLLPEDINTKTAVLNLLPVQPSISHLVSRFLIQLQNNCVDTAARVTCEKQRAISAEEVKPSSVLAVTKNDLVTMALANFQYEIEEDGTRMAYFDFQMLQRQVVQRFISGKPIIKVQTAPSIALNNVRTLQATQTKVRNQLHQESLSVNQQKRIMEEVRSVNAISQTLDTVKVAAEFLAVTGGDPERPLSEYVRQELKMDAGAKQFQDLPVVPSTQLKHILSLWKVLAACKSMLLVQMNQDPFCLVPKKFQEKLDLVNAKALATKLANINLDFFLIELHEMIRVALADFEPHWELKDTFRYFLEDHQVNAASITSLTDVLSPDLLLKEVLAVWRTAAETSQLPVYAYGKGRPAPSSR
ncbi:E3 ubiquitin-protein ligase rnf213-alpha-like [Rhea pennata]|uniref:E3 ubiquitin-protein ligase rnf213-alpha-like n=1 Tax=Rhea pennata TaxID=8795 RepID=UPI002E261FA5